MLLLLMLKTSQQLVEIPSVSIIMQTKLHSNKLNLRNQKEWMEFCQGRLPHKPKKTDTIYTYPEIAYKNEGWKGWEDWLGSSKVKEVHPEPLETEITIDCKCKGRLKNCPDCDGKGYYSVRLH